MSHGDIFRGSRLLITLSVLLFMILWSLRLISALGGSEVAKLALLLGNSPWLSHVPGGTESFIPVPAVPYRQLERKW